MKIILTGGAANGKSFHAEYLASKYPEPRYYLAAMRPYDGEDFQRIARHRELRSGKGFETIERYTDIGGVRLDPSGTVLIECLCNLLANEMFDDTGKIDPNAWERVLRGVLDLSNRCAHIIVVTNDVGSDGVIYEEGVEKYVSLLGRLNAAITAEFDEAFEMVAGIPVRLK
ncbi:MAG: bifunctional adenosylcobinamide kinase/adenosylcobinamide-phosphate guanylyltransferase [Clostridiales bacterium]|nr:bifunctional adenosylcobinamide kinase/adenosylcobinamide-phosphate guanylyltransferase [Clostridiales bacterium]